MLLSRSGDCAIRLAVTGESAGMSTRAPFPTTTLTSKNACGGTGGTPFNIRSHAWILGRAPLEFFATTNLVWVLPDGDKRGIVATPAAGVKERGGTTVPV